MNFTNEYNYAITNENLISIYFGLALNKKSFKKKTGIAINGSTDQGLAMLSSNQIKKLFLIDINEKQLKLSNHKIELIKQKKYDEFRNIQIFGENDGSFNQYTNNKQLLKYHLKQRNAFFSNKRLNQIRKNLDKLELIIGNMLTQNFGNTQFDFMYFSNILSANGLPIIENDYTYTTFLNGKDIITKYKDNIKQNGLIYITNYGQLQEFHIENKFYDDKIFKENFSYNEELSNIAKSGEEYKLNNITGIWTPGVIQKKSKVKKIISKYHHKKDKSKIIEFDDDEIFCQFQ